MIAYRLISIGLLFGGMVLFIFGVSAADSLSSDVSKIIHGSPTDKVIWMLVSGIVLAIMGLFGTLHDSSHRLRPNASSISRPATRPGIDG